MSGACGGCGAPLPGDVARCPLCDSAARVAVLASPWSAAAALPRPRATADDDRPPHLDSPDAPARAAGPDQPASGETSAVPWRAFALPTFAVLVGLAASLADHHLQPGVDRTVSTYLRIAVALTIGVYVVVAAAALVATRDRALVWSRGSWLPAAATGLAIGAACGGLLVARTSLVTGHVVIDPAISAQLSAGAGWAAVGVLVLVVAAPLVEEVVFRGVLVESLRSRGAAVALGVSAPVFWLWHWRLSVSAFLLLTGLGLVLGAVYRWRGLAASVAAHAAYNGVLVAVALTQLAGPAQTHSVAGLTVTAPASWHAVSSVDQLVLTGPAGAVVEIDAVTIDHQPQPDELAQRLTASVSAETAHGWNVSDVTQQQLPVGAASQVVASLGAHHLTVSLFATGGELYELQVDDEGSATAGHQAAQILASLRTS